MTQPKSNLPASIHRRLLDGADFRARSALDLLTHYSPPRTRPAPDRRIQPPARHLHAPRTARRPRACGPRAFASDEW